MASTIAQSRMVVLNDILGLNAMAVAAFRLGRTDRSLSMLKRALEQFQHFLAQFNNDPDKELITTQPDTRFLAASSGHYSAFFIHLECIPCRVATSTHPFHRLTVSSDPANVTSQSKNKSSIWVNQPFLLKYVLMPNNGHAHGIPPDDYVSTFSAKYSVDSHLLSATLLYHLVLSYYRHIIGQNNAEARVTGDDLNGVRRHYIDTATQLCEMAWNVILSCVSFEDGLQVLGNAASFGEDKDDGDNENSYDNDNNNVNAHDTETHENYDDGIRESEREELTLAYSWLPWAIVNNLCVLYAEQEQNELLQRTIEIVAMYRGRYHRRRAKATSRASVEEETRKVSGLVDEPGFWRANVKLWHERFAE